MSRKKTTREVLEVEYILLIVFASVQFFFFGLLNFNLFGALYVHDWDWITTYWLTGPGWVVLPPAYVASTVGSILSIRSIIEFNKLLRK